MQYCGGGPQDLYSTLKSLADLQLRESERTRKTAGESYVPVLKQMDCLTPHTSEDGTDSHSLRALRVGQRQRPLAFRLLQFEGLTHPNAPRPPDERPGPRLHRESGRAEEHLAH